MRCDGRMNRCFRGAAREMRRGQAFPLVLFVHHVAPYAFDTLAEALDVLLVCRRVFEAAMSSHAFWAPFLRAQEEEMRSNTGCISKVPFRGRGCFGPTDMTSETLRALYGSSWHRAACARLGFTPWQVGGPCPPAAQGLLMPYLSWWRHDLANGRATTAARAWLATTGHGRKATCSRGTGSTARCRAAWSGRIAEAWKRCSSTAAGAAHRTLCG